MHASVDIYINEGDPITYRVIADDKALKLYLGADRHALGSVECVMGPRTALVLRDLLTEALDEWRQKLGGEWAEMFPPEQANRKAA